MRFADGLSEHPVATEAAGEVIGQVLDGLGAGPPPDLAALFATGQHTGAVEDVARAVRSTLTPAVFVGATAVSVLGGDREVEDRAALALFAARLGGEPLAVRLEAVRTSEGWVLGGLPPEAAGGGTLLLLVDPFSFPADAFVEHVSDKGSALAVVGGLASAARGPGGNRLVLDDRVYEDGAVGVLLPPGAPVAAVVSQGCRPVGDPMIVTKAEGNVLYELAGKPALERLLALAANAGAGDRALLQQGLHVGVVIDERKSEFGRGDFLVRNVLGADREIGSLAVGDVVDVGATVQFQVRDAASADEDLRETMTDRHASGALVFTCNGRGTQLFGTPDHDAGVVHAALHGGATAGMFCAGELGPIGGRSFLHGLTASVLLFGDGTN
jgi:small ligand-binding sensory domain FIST